MKKALLILFVCLAATGVQASDQCVKENLQLKQKLIELQGQILQSQYIELAKELEDIKAKEQVKAEEPKNDN